MGSAVLIFFVSSISVNDNYVSNSDFIRKGPSKDEKYASGQKMAEQYVEVWRDVKNM